MIPTIVAATSEFCHVKIGDDFRLAALARAGAREPDAALAVMLLAIR
jgi:Trk K+ transport system NAD-binding subunit